MLKEKISSNQLLTIILYFNLGSSLIIGLGKDTMEDAWITVLITSFIGILISMFYNYFQELIPKKNFFDIVELIFNRPISIIITLTYIIYFFYLAERVTRDFGELISVYVIPNTPIEFSMFLLLFIIGYILYLGIEVLGRVTEVFTPYGLFFIFLLTILLFSSGNMEMKKIQPILANGVTPLFQSIFPYEIIRPYGQLFALTFFFSSLPTNKITKKTIISAVFISGIILSIVTFTITASLGASRAIYTNFPLVGAARLINIADFIQRLDALAVFIIALGVIIKIAIFLLAGLKGLEYIFQIPYRFFVFPMICVSTLFSTFISFSLTDHLQESVTVVPYLLSLPFFFMFPAFLMIIMLFKHQKN
ncbi:GerAB/ArcD/ProY family transporter [Bacillus sp. B1-b2]|uniref:GerAB/ArcD/ProY family transporter n=1 Tax=Bacillus sp. B1-b2 TaxID=2653201 RepID=UPI00126214E3|nr:GerAB/ArcD/ProY family transporter [Bacillus sp. B1-b2]KAB7669940.1 GerAB/ArcD/ProY family transporter [Bacillus sp. B1-b2]